MFIWANPPVQTTWPRTDDLVGADDLFDIDGLFDVDETVEARTPDVKPLE